MELHENGLSGYGLTLENRGLGAGYGASLEFYNDNGVAEMSLSNDGLWANTASVDLVNAEQIVLDGSATISGYGAGIKFGAQGAGTQEFSAELTLTSDRKSVRITILPGPLPVDKVFTIRYKAAFWNGWGERSIVVRAGQPGALMTPNEAHLFGLDGYKFAENGHLVLYFTQPTQPHPFVQIDGTLRLKDVQGNWRDVYIDGNTIGASS